MTIYVHYMTIYVHYMTIYEQMLGYIRREPFVVCRIKRVKI